MDEPQVYFSTRPEIPAAGTDLEDRWAKDATIAYEGGYIKSAYGNLAQTWNLKGLVSLLTLKRSGTLPICQSHKWWRIK